jgi:cell division protein FtsA
MGKRSSQLKNRTGLIAALDVGTTKASCFIARMNAEGKPEIIGVGYRISKGLQCGTIIDMDNAEDTIRATVEAAEQMAGENICEVFVNFSAGQPKSRLIAYEISIGGHEIGEADMRRVLDPASLFKELPKEHELIHAIPVGFSVDGNRGVRDPKGLFGQCLGVNMHMVSAPAGSMRNLEMSVARCHLGLKGKIISPYASALACLSEDEKQLGVTYMDMGGGTTSIAVFFDNELFHTDNIPLGGIHVTNDIARGLSTPMNHAERIKTMFGSALPSSSDDQEIIEVPVIGEEEGGEMSQVPLSMVIGIIRPRLEEIFEMARDRLREFAASALDKQVRLARPKSLQGLPEAVSGPAFATCLGLLKYAENNPADVLKGGRRLSEEPNGRLGRIGQWMRENF